MKWLVVAVPAGLAAALVLKNMLRKDTPSDTPTPSHEEQQKQVRLRAALGLCAGLAPYALTYCAGVRESLAAPADVSPLEWTLRWSALPLATMASQVMNVGNTRFASPNAITGKNSEDVELPKRILQNTLEQTVLWIGANAALSTYLSPTQSAFIPLNAATFVIARLIFIHGYTQQPNNAGGRAPGFAMTFLPNIVVIAQAVLKLVNQDAPLLIASA
eukprot:TRINITY_DN94425_c0_g1_i1.p1 TRINITY_DN94425_c0_g1~~TRINITY_DN94425_c0_g1_i1.p1  ORF type:complete len:248 (+),score=19.95 TRINITY_DN94425_c0_g1_i1:96-746(+)